MDDFSDLCHGWSGDPTADAARRAHANELLELVGENLAEICSAVKAVAPGMYTIELEPVTSPEGGRSLLLSGVHDTFGSPLLEPAALFVLANDIATYLAVIHAVTPPTKWVRTSRCNPGYAPWWLDDIPFPPPLTPAEQARRRPAGLPPNFGALNTLL